MMTIIIKRFIYISTLIQSFKIHEGISILLPLNIYSTLINSLSLLVISGKNSAVGRHLSQRRRKP